MRLVRTVVALCCVASSLEAQDTTLRVLGHTPGDTASPGNLVTVTFDRPVAGRLDGTIEAARIFRIEPGTKGRVAWRDPITIRFVPDEPLTPGAEFTVTVDTAFRAIDGSRLARPYRFSFRVPGPRLLARSFGGEYRYAPAVLPLDGRVQLLYSAPVDLGRLERGVRIEPASCESAPRPVAMRAVRQRPVSKTDPYSFTYAGGWDRDTVADRFRRVVELEPATPLPPECSGQLVLPTTADDAVNGREERFAVLTAPRFRLRAFDCSDRAACSMNGLTLAFTAPVKRGDVLRHVRLEPAVSLKLSEQPERAEQWRLELRLAPRSTYTVVVDAALRDVHGRPIEAPRRARVVTGDYVPSIGYARGTLTLPRSGPRTIPLRHVNVSAVRVVSYRILESERSGALAVAPARLGGWLAEHAVRPEVTTLAVGGTFNVETVTELPLPPIATAPGVALLAMRVEVAEEIVGPLPGAVRPASLDTRLALRYATDFEYALVQLTDLAVHAKLAPGEGTVLVTGLTDARPRPGAAVRQLDGAGRVLAEGTTDSTGVAVLHRPGGRADDPRERRKPISGDWPPRVGQIEASLGADRVVTPLTVRAIGYVPANPLETWRLGGRAGEVPAATATLLAERGIYRPGEMLYLTGIVRRGVLGALVAPPASDSARLTVTYRPHAWEDDDEVVIRDTVLALSDFGTVADSLRLRPDLALGTYVAALHVAVDGSWDEVAQESVRVAEYRAPEFLVETRVDSTPRFGGDTVRVQATGRYLFGAPMGRASVSWGAVLREVYPWELHIPGAEGWTLGEWDWWSWRDQDRTPPRRLGGEDTLDARGRVELRVPIAGLRPSRPGRMEVDVAVVDVNRQAVTSTASVPVHPARLYVLARARSGGSFWTARQRATVEIRTVRPDGTRLRGVPVTVSVARRDWRWYGGESAAGQWTEKPIRTDTVRTGDGPVAYSFVPASGGVYELRLSAADAHGGVARTTLSAYAVDGGSGWWARSAFHLPLVSDGREAAVGDTARVAFDSPFDDAEGWVTIERERVLERRRIAVRRGPNIVPLRITEAHAPNVWVSVLLLRRAERSAGRPDSAAQLMRVGYTELRVSTASKRLAVTVEPRAAEYRPGDSAAVRVRVRDAAGRGTRSAVTLWAVDQGVLALTGFETPDVLARMYRPRGLGAGTWSTLPTVLTADPGLLVELARLGVLRLSSTVALSGSVAGVSMSRAAAEPEAIRSLFRPTAFYIASTRTDGEGDGEVRARLPDNLTTYRLMAVAVSADDRFGSGDATLLVTRPLVARPTLPRFVRAGDSLLAGAAVNARDGRERQVTVRAASEGIALRGDSSRSIVLAEGKGAEARFTFAVPPRDSVRDTVVVRLGASDGTNGDAVESRLPVRPDFHRRTHTRIGALRDAADVVVELPADMDTARSRLSLRVGTSPLAPMLAAYDWLRVYPYYCTEQIASGGRALLAVWRATRDRDPNALGGDPRPRLQELADELARRQRSDGAIRYWNDHDWTSPWLTAYAGLFLLEARAQGVAVDSMVLGRVARFLSAVAKSPIDSGGMNRYERRSRRLALGDRVAVVEYLRRFGEPDPKSEDALLRLAPGMTWEDRLRLAEALASRQDMRGQAQALVDAAWHAVTPAGRRVDLPDSAHAEREFPSRVAPAARLLTASLALRPDHPLLGGLIETVLQHGRAEGRWAWSTQDYASVVLALAELSGDADQAREVRVLGGGRTVLSRRVGSADSATSVPVEGLLERGRDGTVQLRLRLSTTRSEKPVYYAVSVDEIPSKPPVTPDIQGIVVERWYERFDDGRPVTSVKEGDLVRVRLRVTVPADRQFIAVEDPLPAGLEPLDLSLRTSGTLQPFVTPESERAQAEGDRDRDGPRWQSWLYGRWDDGWWSPWEHKALHDDRVVYFARMLWAGSYSASYVARATTAGTFVRPPAHAEEMYNPAVQGRSDGGRFGVEERRP